MCGSPVTLPAHTHTHTHTQSLLVDGTGRVSISSCVCSWVYFMYRPVTGIPSLATQLLGVAFVLLLFSGACRTKKTWPVSFPQEELRKRLTPMQYHVTQERGTESAFAGEFAHHKEEGTYTCVVCGTPLFSSNTKFDSGSGWPSFFDLMKEESITLSDDFSYGMHRVETTCSQCGAHLGHLFDDGPRPTGKRYCINSASLAFQPKDSASSTATAEGGASSSSVNDGKTEL